MDMGQKNPQCFIDQVWADAWTPAEPFSCGKDQVKSGSLCRSENTIADIHRLSDSVREC